jgi:hypothetical protein
MSRCRVASMMLLLAVLGGCATAAKHSKETQLDETLKSYAATVRWGDMTQAEAFLAPDYREHHPLSKLDLSRYHQVQVTWYHDAPAVPVSANEVSQTVEIGLVNVNTQGARSVVDHQLWRYDDKAERWWLVSGLPDITANDAN